jgi:hypothetical protein
MPQEPGCSRLSPFQRDVGRLILARDRQGIGEEETRRGTLEVGGPSGASQTRATTSVGARFLPSIAPSRC